MFATYALCFNLCFYSPPSNCLLYKNLLGHLYRLLSFNSQNHTYTPMTPASTFPSYTRTQSVCLILASPYPCRICTIARRHFVVIVPLQTTLYKVALFRFVAKLDLLCRWIHSLKYPWKRVSNVNLAIISLSPSCSELQVCEVCRLVHSILFHSDGCIQVSHSWANDKCRERRQLRKRAHGWTCCVSEVSSFVSQSFPPRYQPPLCLAYLLDTRSGAAEHQGAVARLR